MKARTWLVALLLLMPLAGPLTAQGSQDIRVDAEPVACIPIGDNAIAWAKVDYNVADTSTRLYFRRLNDQVEDFYYVEMKSVGDGRYWGAFPKAEDHPLDRHDLEERRREEYREATGDDEDRENLWASWWRAKDSSDHRDPNSELDEELIRERASVGKREVRDWMRSMDDETFQEWLEQLKNEPAEYFVRVVDGQGRSLAQSEMKVVEVLPEDECEIEFTPQQAGEKENLTVGESGPWQREDEVFHWKCDGVVTRIDPYGVVRADDICRVCVIAWWKRKGVLIPAIIGGAVATAVIIEEQDDDPVSPSSP